MTRWASTSNSGVWKTVRVAIASSAIALVALSALYGPADVASAAPATVNVTVEAVDYLTGSPISSVQYGSYPLDAGFALAYKVAYSCSAATCEGMTVQMAPIPGNPLNGVQGITYYTFAGPSGAIISGTDATGKLISLGDVETGSGTFTVIYFFSASAGVAAPTNPMSYYPPGFQFPMSATAVATNAPSVVAAAAPVTWGIQIPNPSISLSNPGTSTLNTNVTYTLGVASGAFVNRGDGNIVGTSRLLAGGAYVEVYHLPAEATYVSSTNAGVYDPVARTVTWTLGSAAVPVTNAARGWNNSVTVRYLPTSFPQACNFDTTVSGWAEAAVTYVDTPRTTKSVSTAPLTHLVSCWDPFARATSVKDSTSHASSGVTRLVNIPPDVTGIVCPGSGKDDWNRTCSPGGALTPFANYSGSWNVLASNQSNVTAVATVVDNTLDQPDMPVFRIDTTATVPAPTINWSYQCSTGGLVTGTTTGVTALLTAAQQANGCRYTAATVTSGTLAAANARPADTNSVSFLVRYSYTVSVGAAIGTRVNTADVTMTYPAASGLPPTVLPPASRAVTLRAMPKIAVTKAAFSATVVSASPAGGGTTTVPGRDVTFVVRGATANIPADVDITPQYVFIAPAGWAITPGSASFAASVPAGVTYSYATKTVGGVARQVVVATWPNTVVFGENVTWPEMSVVAHATSAVAASTTSIATAWMGDSRRNWDNTEATYGGAVQDLPDVDDDGDTTTWFASGTRNILVLGSDSMGVSKEICLPTPSAADGCAWIANPDTVVGVSPSAAAIKYRVTLTNTGNTTLTGVVAYDVLPHIGDYGISDDFASTPRNSMFSETVTAVSDVSPALTLAYSASTNPNRPQVFTGISDPADWDSSAAGKKAIRATVTGGMAPGQVVSFVYTAAISAGAPADAKACNSVAVDTNQTLPSEPRAVCASTQEADLEISVGPRLPLQEGRPGVLPFTVINHGGSQETTATVTASIPAGLTVTSLAPAGWTCVPTPGGTAPVVGPASLSCTPVDALGGPRLVQKDTPETLDIAAIVTSPVISCVSAGITGPMNDPVSPNNTTQVCPTVTSSSAVGISKDDGRSIVAVGDVYDYTIVVTNPLVGEALAAVNLTDTLAAGLEFVSASDGATESGGVVIWPAFPLSASGTPSLGGGTATGAAGSSTTRTVTVRVLPGASGSIVNTAAVSVADPQSPSSTLTGSASDTDQLRKLAVVKSTDAPPAGILEGDEVVYTVTLTNVGTSPYTLGTPASLRDDLSAVLDDAAFVADSASITVAGGPSTPLADPVGGILSWSGPLSVGDSAVLVYRVTAGPGGDRELNNVVFTSASVSCDPDTALDALGFSCAMTTTPFAPTISKTVQSLTQRDDGNWEIVYALDVANLNQGAAVSYTLNDSLRFGAGITTVSAAVTASPAGAVLGGWSGAGFVASSSIAAGATQHYELTVVASASAVVGTPAAQCISGLASGFANEVTFEPMGADVQTEQACAMPVAPSVTKTAAPPIQNTDGTWSVAYTVTVHGPAQAPLTGLSYSLDDVFDFPNGVNVQSVSVAGPSGAPVNPLFDGDGVTGLLNAVDRVAASSSRIFTVTVTADVPAGSVTGSELACAPAGTGGYVNAVRLFAGSSSAQLSAASACERVVAQPTPQISKRVTASSIDATSGDWTLVYEIVVTNPDANYSTSYDLTDELQFGDGIVVVSAGVQSNDAIASAGWDGIGDTLISQGVALAGAQSHVYTSTVVASVLGTATDLSMDCRLDAGETGTGFRNVATLTSGLVSPSPFAVGCEAATDPSVVKTTVGSATQDPLTGLWTIQYEITVTNRSTTTVGGGIPYVLTDTFDFAAGVQVVTIDVDGAPGSTVDTSFDGALQPVLASASIGAAVDDNTPATQVYSLTVELTIPAGLSAAERSCDPAQGHGGLANAIEIAVGPRVMGDVACLDVPETPVLGVSKTVLSQDQQADGTWVVLYRVIVANPSATVAGFYDLDDEFAFGAGITLDSPATIVGAPAGVSVNHGTWNGTSSTLISENVLLGANASHQYTVRAVIDSGSVSGTAAAGDCSLTGGETGTGFWNTAIVDSGSEARDADACARAFDPVVSKTLNGLPVRNADGSWTLRYFVTVTNPSPTAGLAYELTDTLSFPSGTAIHSAAVRARGGGPVASSTWDGVADQVVAPAGTPLVANGIHVFDVVVIATLPANQGSLVDGWANTAGVSSSTGGVVASDSTAYADIEVPELSVTKSNDAAAVVRIGDVITYTITVENVGVGDFTTSFPAEVWDYLEDVIDDATFGGPVTAAPAIGTFAYEPDRFSWVSPLASGDSVDITYSVTVTGAGDQDLRNVAYAPDLPGTDPDEPTTCSPDGCAELSTPLPGFLLEKTVSAGVVSAGDSLTYTITYTNTGTVDVTGATFTDDLSAVHDDAGSAVPVASSGTVTVAGDDLTWVGDLNGGQSVTVTYTVTVASPLTGDGLLENTATADPDFATRWPGGTCPAGPAPCAAPDRVVMVSTAVRALAFTKSVDVTHATVGQKVTYTVTLTNIGAADYTSSDPAVVADNLTGVLDDATYNGDATATSGNLAYLAPNLSWSGALAASSTVVVRFSVTVKPQLGDARLLNTVGLAANSVAAAQCLAAPVDNAGEACFTSTTIAPLANTGASFSIVSILVALLLFLVGCVFFLLHRRRTRREQESHT